MSWIDPKRGDPVRIHYTEDERGYVFRETGVDGINYFTATADDKPLTKRNGEEFLFGTLKSAKASVESILTTGKWKRPSRRYREYPTYDPRIEGYGNETQWRKTFGLLTAAPASESYAILEVVETDSWGKIKASYRRLSLLHHPDHGGSTDMFVRIRAAYENLKEKIL